MEIKTKFNLGQRIQCILQGIENIEEKCLICEGKGFFFYKEKKIYCQECGGEGSTIKHLPAKWYVPKGFDNVEWSNFVIQKIGVEMYNSKNKKMSDYKDRIYYMAGNSGTMWNENNCFASIEKAQAECDKRNGVSHE